MEQQESPFVQGAKVLGIAGIAAGVAGAVLGRVLESQREPTAGERLQAVLSDARASGAAPFIEQVSDAVGKARADFEGSLKKTQKRRRKAKGRKGKREEVDLATLAATGMSFADHMRRVARERADRIGEDLQETLEGTSESLSKGTEESRKAAQKRSEQLRKEAQSRAVELRKEARSRGKELRKEAGKRREVAGRQASEGLEELMKFRKDATEKAEDRLHDVEKRTRETVEKRVRPALERAGAVTLATAGEARHWLEEETKDLEKRYAKARPKIEKRYAKARPKVEKAAEQYAESASELVKELRKAARERASEAEHLLEEGTEQARELAQEAPAQAKELAQEAAGAAKQGGKDATSLLVWTAIAGGLIYQVLLDEEQKRKVRELAMGIYHEGKAMYQDMRGENADFAAS